MKGLAKQLFDKAFEGKRIEHAKVGDVWIDDFMPSQRWRLQAPKGRLAFKTYGEAKRFAVAVGDTPRRRKDLDVKYTGRDGYTTTRTKIQ